MLVDFGSCHFEGAERLTWQSLPQGTPEYFSPQALLFYLRSLHHPEGYYPPSPADDLYALGVTAYRLVMGEYQVPINGGCWVESYIVDAQACEKSGYVFFKGKCFGLALEPPRKPQPTSSPPKAR